MPPKHSCQTCRKIKNKLLVSLPDGSEIMYFKDIVRVIRKNPNNDYGYITKDIEYCPRCGKKL